jgi:hypothetical protein
MFVDFRNLLIAEGRYQRWTALDTNVWNFIPKRDLKG